MIVSTRTITAADVAREGNILVILPWDGRVGELYATHRRQEGGGPLLYGLYGKAPSPSSEFAHMHVTWAHLLMEMYCGGPIRRAPEGSELGGLV